MSSPTNLPSWWFGLRIALAALFLNFLLSLNNWWPTAAVWPDARLAPELVYTWALLLLCVALAGSLRRWVLFVFSLAYTLLALGRYFDVTVPALFGRPVNLYWDGQQIPRFLWVSAQGLPWWASMGAVLSLALLLWGLYSAVRVSLAVLGRDAAPLALRSRAVLGVSALLVGVSLANLGGWQASWPYISRPVLPTYERQARLLFNAFLPGRAERVLPASPAFDSALAGLNGADVKIVMLESYGAVAFDRPGANEMLAASRAALLAQVERNGQRMVSAFVKSATFGGASDLAHLSLLSGIDLTDPMRHDLLLTTERPTLTTLFRNRGYRTVGMYPGLSWDWDEKRFYGFEHFLEGRTLGYRGPHLGYWLIPDQFTLARAEELVPARTGTPPRFMFFPTITSHMPFNPVPPYQPDWTRVLGAEPFDKAEVDRAQAEQVNWLDMWPAYLRMIEYNYRWLTGHLEQPRDREELLVILGDHQPVASVSGDGASWDVPVHIVSRDAALLERLVKQGFKPGLMPQQRQALGGQHDLTRILLDVFDGRPVAASVQAPVQTQAQAPSPAPTRAAP